MPTDERSRPNTSRRPRNTLDIAVQAGARTVTIARRTAVCPRFRRRCR